MRRSLTAALTLALAPACSSPADDGANPRQDAGADGSADTGDALDSGNAGADIDPDGGDAEDAIRDPVAELDGAGAGDPAEGLGDVSWSAPEIDMTLDMEVEPGATTSVSGHAFNFGPGGGAIVGASVTILEMPERETVTGEDGSFRFDEIPVGAVVSLVLADDARPPIQTGTHLVPPEGIERLTFQAPTWDTYDLLASVARVTPSPDLCQVATTVTRRGNSLYDTTPGSHGEPGATVSIAAAAGDGPIYFYMARYDTIYPLRSLTETTYDGGVLFLEVPPGTYLLQAHKEGTVFRDVVITCRAGFIVNASPPWGLQAVDGGVGPRDPDAEF